MKLFSSVHDISNLKESVNQALMLKADPFGHQKLGKNKTLGLVFLNPSLRTRLSTQKAALNLGMNVMVMNLDKEGWALETEDGVVMNGTTVEHIREAAAVMGEYCDILGFRSFPKLQNRDEDYSEGLFNKFVKFSGVPVISLESATLHPLQSFADLITIEENKKIVKPKVVLTWAPHVKALPQAVPNSFSEWMCRAQAEGMVDFVITHPQGLELAEKFTPGAKIEYNQDLALQGADFVYAKNWSSYTDYGKTVSGAESWMMTHKKLEQTHEAKVMHCLPVRRDFELSAEVLDGPHSIVIKEAANRVWSAQMVLKNMLEGLK
ncbi:acetylornithine carbamoyltransferase [Daejeonella sp.]|jgi:N-succinyl-L-ornithine transcarbamylase|uniref:acetylornithine carbamoyltransferase n=1 Tax=Daejeonella sp. TaxID=2805397 RepID=UPI003782F2F2